MDRSYTRCDDIFPATYHTALVNHKVSGSKITTMLCAFLAGDEKLVHCIDRINLMIFLPSPSLFASVVKLEFFFLSSLKKQKHNRDLRYSRTVKVFAFHPQAVEILFIKVVKIITLMYEKSSSQGGKKNPRQNCKK